MNRHSWNSSPSYDSQDFLQKLLRTNTNVSRHTRLSPSRYTADRHRGATMELYLTPVYILGEADYAELRMECPDVNGIVLASTWNSATLAVYGQGIDDGVGIYDMKALMGALNIEDDERRVRHGAPPRDGTRLGMPRPRRA